MENEMQAKINFKKIGLLSLALGVVIFLIKNIIMYSIYRKTGIELFASLGLSGISLVLYSFFYYYIHAFVSLSIFVYIRASLPDEYKKAGLIFACISFLFGDTIYSVLKLATDRIPNSSFGYNVNFGVSESITSIISILFIGFIVSYTFERFYKK